MAAGVASARVLTGAASRFGRGAAAAASAAGRAAVLAPMPGKVVKVLVTAGDEVKARQGLVVVEAMKMENELRSPKDGRVTEVLVAEGRVGRGRASAGGRGVAVLPMTFKETARLVWRHARRAGVIALGFLAAGIVTSVSVDLGTLFPQIRRYAEPAGSRRIERPLHIGGLSIRVFDGHFVVHDLVIDGIDADRRAVPPRPRDRRGDAALAAAPGQLTITNVTMTDWQMKVETFPGGRHTFPRFASNNPSSGPSPIKFSVAYVHAVRGQFTYEDHGTPWSTVVRNLDVTVLRLVGYRGYSHLVGRAHHGPEVRRRWAWTSGRGSGSRTGRSCSIASSSTRDGAKTTLHRASWISARWPEQTYQVDSTIQLPPMRGDLVGPRDVHARRARRTSRARSTSSRAAGS